MTQVLGELETLELAIAGRSIARVGEGELRVAIGSRCKTQESNAACAAEMRAVLALPASHACLPCLPRVWPGMPAEDFWRRFTRPPYTPLYRTDPYGSAFITRTDVATGLGTDAYWTRVRDLWRGKDAVLVLGTARSLRPSAMPEARSVREVWGPRDNAYREIDRIEEEIGRPEGPVILCLGSAATILAMRLAAKGVHALDLGHLGMFLPYDKTRRGSDFITRGYAELQRELHARAEGYGKSGQKYAAAAAAWAKKLGAETVLDYGCGEGNFAREIAKTSRLPVAEYDPAVAGRETLPKPAHLVVCTDVLEHVEPDRLPFVLAHLWMLAERGAFLSISTRPAKKTLADGRNAHLIQEALPFWMDALQRSGWVNFERIENVKGKELRLWLRK